ncbi:eCIS core domain-containing protein [Agromyces soli]
MRIHSEEQGLDFAPQQKQNREAPASLTGLGAHRPDVLGRDAMLRLQREAGNGAVGELVEEQRSPVLDVVQSGGSSLDSGVRGDMEARLGADFGDVRVHTGADAHASAQSVGAHAYTVGNHVVFQRDAYDPGSQAGRTTIAHELTHVMQQRSGPVDGTPAGGGVSVSDPGDRFERAAADNAARVMSDPAPVQRHAEGDEEEAPVQGSFVQREEAAEEEEEQA